jgi:hypothetical protein
MKILKSELKQIIKEECIKILNEGKETNIDSVRSFQTHYKLKVTANNMKVFTYIDYAAAGREIEPEASKIESIQDGAIIEGFSKGAGSQVWHLLPKQLIRKGVFAVFSPTKPNFGDRRLIAIELEKGNVTNLQYQRDSKSEFKDYSEKSSEQPSMTGDPGLYGWMGNKRKP